jgi:hypothetical protein
MASFVDLMIVIIKVQSASSEIQLVCFVGITQFGGEDYVNAGGEG